MRKKSVRIEANLSMKGIQSSQIQDDDNEKIPRYVYPPPPSPP